MKKQIFVLVFFSTITFGQTNSETTDTIDYSYMLNLIDTTLGKNSIDTLIVSNVKYYEGDDLSAEDSLICKIKIVLNYRENILAIENPKTYKLEFFNLYFDYESLNEDELIRVYQGDMHNFFYFFFKIDQDKKRKLYKVCALQNIAVLNEYETLSMGTFYIK